MGAAEPIAVEANSINFLKCLCVKEIHDLKAKFALGDIQSYLDGCSRQFDIVVASRVLYHSQEPIRFLEQATRVEEHLYLWMHYYSETIHTPSNGQDRHFISA